MKASSRFVTQGGGDCVGAAGLRQTCVSCLLDGKPLESAEPCLAPSQCVQYECTIPFVAHLDLNKDYFLSRYELLAFFDEGLEKSII